MLNITWSRKGLFFMFSDMFYINLDKFTYLLVLDMVIVKLHYTPEQLQELKLPKEIPALGNT